MKSTFSRFFGNSEKEELLETDTAERSEDVIKVPLADIIPNRFQPRTIFDEEKIDELARTINIHGVIQPIVVRPIEDGKYEIIAGERRYRAMKKLKWSEVPAIVRDMDDKETASVALIENLQREELTAIEEAMAYDKLLKLHSLTQEALAQRLGKGQSTVANKLRLLKLPDPVRRGILDRQISERHARSLLALKDEELQLQLFEEIKEQEYNVKQLEERIHQILNPEEDEEEEEKKPKTKRKAVSKDVRIALNTIRQSLSLVKQSGIHLKTEEEDEEDFYKITVRIPKKK
ncbi:nucleoid occlusion protein [Edaphobacillus lindanitolerans]|uniref:Nucleoid occlusion protein n=1 Tax=Edaphobacillus lindanitolerans TaxID=550447 RepID=A0A1U7PKT3_9BACI|nr:nucleoid occlusion protein [Edaphobacillus lindanitolerans]SIT87054.1 chromosome partitioning protein, ParB family [Edaphobacillus lindanitolerans]